VVAVRSQRRKRAATPTRCRGDFERAVRAQGYRYVAGLDEAGRGCLFGPVYAAAVILSPERSIRGLNDSKQLTREDRESLAIRIRERAVAWAVASVDAGEIDRINIYEASRRAMLLALQQLDPPADYLLVDALTLDSDLPQQGLIKGDARCRSIAAASILAKVGRDDALNRYDRLYPLYGFAHHKGYGTPEHLEALSLHGPLAEHRRTFAPVRQAMGLPPLSKNRARRAAEVLGQMSIFEQREVTQCQ
jgi:ribonuclease HII